MLWGYGDRHNPSNLRVYRLPGWGLEAGPNMGVTWHWPSNAVTTEVVTTNKRERLKTLLCFMFVVTTSVVALGLWRSP
ncbi:hypothetical protein [Oscillatoria sp. HE19RPO]|uniref:hypothetical protein n=1 Tax=Oscillatoria sp. HE19RPO TaxID=2954806 RepID=UPI0020C23426|nr:hypothetical protein [Oscillatoria sp. HE19RPO]